MIEANETPKPNALAGRLDGLVGRLISPSYRICTDLYQGYEVQIRRWWYPFWVELGVYNTQASIEAARKLINAYENKRKWRSKLVEKVTPNAAVKPRRSDV